jgi:hypothetical protein
MKRRFFLAGLSIGLIAAEFVGMVQAASISSETIQTVPATTENMWSYSMVDSYSGVTSHDWYATSISQLAGGSHLGYVEGSANYSDRDYFRGPSGFQSLHVFDTYIMSTFDQSLTLYIDGDDGHSLFIDGSFVGGGGFNANVRPTINLLANTAYHLTLAGANYGGPYVLHIGLDVGTNNMYGGTIDSVAGIVMNADINDLTPVPVPASMFLFSAGIAGLAGLKVRLKNNHRRTTKTERLG